MATLYGRLLLAITASTTPAWVQLIQAIAWPLVALTGLLLAAFSGTIGGWLSQVVARLQKVSALGVDVELTPEASAQVREVTAEALDAFRKKITVEFDRLVHTYQIRSKRNMLIDQHVIPLLETVNRRPDFRCTIHVEDVLFTETLYQLLDYYPQGGGPPGRIRSVRFGILGKAWRSARDQVDPHVSTDPDVLIQDWGMTRDEAVTAGSGRRSFACVIVTDEHGVVVGAVYMDSEQEGFFPEDETFRTRLGEVVRQGAKQVGLTDALTQLLRDLRTRSPLIPLYGSGAH